MTPTPVTQILHANHPSLKAATCIQSPSVNLSRQLHHAFRPASAQLQQPLRSRRPFRASQVIAAPTVVTAASDDHWYGGKGFNGTLNNAASVEAALTEAGLSQDAIDYMLANYLEYRRWDVEQKLLPAMQCWQQELGDQFVHVFERNPQTCV